VTEPARHLAWSGRYEGGHAEVVAVEDDAVTLRSTTSAPPGARLEAMLASGEAVRIKSHGTHRENDGTFTLRGRLIDARRELRDAIAALAAANSGDTKRP
jgi:hypothetical protein